MSFLEIDMRHLGTHHQGPQRRRMGERGVVGLGAVCLVYGLVAWPGPFLDKSPEGKMEARTEC